MKSPTRSVVVKILPEDRARSRRWGLHTPLEWAVWRACRGYFYVVNASRTRQTSRGELKLVHLVPWSGKRARALLRPKCFGGYLLKVPGRLFRPHSPLDTLNLEDRWREGDMKRFPL